MEGSKTSYGSKEKMSVDEILSSAKYALSARKTWTKEELAQAKNVKLIKTAKKQKKSNLLLKGSPSKYNFPSREECLRRLGSPVKGTRNDTEGLLQNKSVKRNVLNDSSALDAIAGQEELRPKRSSPRSKKSDTSVSTSVTPGESSLVASSNTCSIEISARSTATNVSPAKETAAELISSLLEVHSACMEGRKTPWEVIQLFPPLLEYLDKHHDESVREELSQFIKSVECIREEVMNRNKSIDDLTPQTNREERLLRHLQIQIWARIMIWNYNRDEGLSVLKQLLGTSQNKVDGKSQSKGTGKRKKGKKKTNAEVVEPSSSQSFVQGVIRLFELVPYVLPPSKEFAQWLKDALTFGYRQSIPEFGVEILDHFEVEVLSNSGGSAGLQSDGNMRRKTEVEVQSQKSQSSAEAHSSSKPVAKGKAQQQAYFSSLARKPLHVNADCESATIGSDATIAARSHKSSSTGSSRTFSQSDKETDATLFKTSVSLTVAVPKRKENPFLKGSARGVYVGSHFNSKLSNISSLFREVRAPPKSNPNVITAKRKDPPKPININTEAAKSAPIVAATQLRTSETASINPSSALAFINKKYNTSHEPFNPPSETPRKKLKPMPTTRHQSISARSGSTFVAATPLQIIGETPAKQTAFRRDIARFGGRNLSLVNNNNIVGATPLQIIGETPHAKQPARNAARRLKPNALDGIFVRHSADTTPRPRQYSGSAGGLCFGLSPIPHGSKSTSTDETKNWD